MEDLWFRQAMMADPETMNYNNAWSATIPFPHEKWADWYDYWVRNPQNRFYRYIKAAYHYDEDLKIYIADIIISAKCRRHGYEKASLQMLCESAQKEKIPELYDNIAIDNPGINLFIQCGFQEEYRTNEIIMLKKSL